MEIGNEVFDMKKYINRSENELLFNSNIYKSIYECYDRPSITKANIYTYWKNILSANCDDVIYYGIDSYNGWMFTLHSLIKIDNKLCYVYITKTRQEIRVIKED